MSNILPNALVKRLGLNPLFDQEAFQQAHESSTRLTSIRVNPAKPSELLFPLEKPVPWCETGFYLDQRPSFTLDPFFHAGAYYVQEASSMFIWHIIKHLELDKKDLCALDACAAPGGKASLLSSVLSSGSLLLANELIKSRSIALAENLMRWGKPNVLVSNNDPSAFKRLPGFFDLLLVDAPCSGSGMFRKDTDSVDQWSEAHVQLCYERQQRILAQLMDSLAEDGYLIYSTCSYSQEENEDMVDWLLKNYELESVQIPLQQAWGIEESLSDEKGAYGYRFYPHKTEGEGFFVSVLRLKKPQPSFSLKKLKLDKQAVSPKVLRGWVENPQEFSLLLHNKLVHFFPAAYQAHIAALQRVLYLKNAGTIAGKWLGDSLLPAHDLAMSIHQDKNLVSQEVDLATAQEFLRKGQLDPALFQRSGKGWCLVKFRGLSLGWVKVLGGRINNYYPMDVRIAHL